MRQAAGETDAGVTLPPGAEVFAGILQPLERAATGFHALQGFPGLLLLIAFAAVALGAIPGNQIQSAGPIALLCLGGSIATYVLERYLDWRVAQTKSDLLHEYTRMLVTKYIESRERYELENSNTAIRDIIRPLLRTSRSR